MRESKAITVKKAECDAVEGAFSELMSKTVCLLNEKAKMDNSLFRKATAFEIENLSTDAIKDSCFGTPFNPCNVKLVSGQKFPDIIAENHFGVEVKTTVKNHWVSTGSSIVESTRDCNIDSIYMLFGKLGGSFAEFDCRPYQDVLYDIAVTHSPRYLINMKLGRGESIFEKMGISYNSLRNSSNSIKDVRRYYRNKALKEGKKEMPWWLTEDDDSGVNDINIKMWKEVPLSTKRMLTDQMLILFPEILNSEFDDAALWLCTTKGIINTHFRDIYTAGGKLKTVNGIHLEYNLPRVFYYVVNDAPHIKRILYEDFDFRTYVEEFNPQLLRGDMFEQWISQIKIKSEKMGLVVPIDDWISNGCILE